MHEEKMKEPKSLLDYISGVSKLYAERETTSNQEDRAIVSDKIAKYRKLYGDKEVNFDTAEDTFTNLVLWFTEDKDNLIKATESKFSVVLRLLNQSNVISNKDYESAVKQFRAINRDFKIEVTNKDGK